MVESASLLTRCPFTGTVGSNPTLSAKLKFLGFIPGDFSLYRVGFEQEWGRERSILSRGGRYGKTVGFPVVLFHTLRNNL